MAKIPFPDLPNSPGVSDIPINTGNVISSAADINTSNIIAAIKSNSFLSAYITLFGLSYGIYKAGIPVIEVDTIVETNVSNQSQISDFPTEEGAFQTYNKVAIPAIYTFQMIKTNSLIGDSKAAVINALQGLLRAEKAQYATNDITSSLTNQFVSNIEFVDVVTPHKTYTNVQLERFEVTENVDNGNAIIIQVILREVIQPVMTSRISSQPDGARKSTLGQFVAGDINQSNDYIKKLSIAAIEK